MLCLTKPDALYTVHAELLASEIIGDCLKTKLTLVFQTEYSLWKETCACSVYV